jgi:hypothetical protein
MYDSEDSLVELVEQLYLEGMTEEAEQVQLIMIKYLAKISKDE